MKWPEERRRQAVIGVFFVLFALTSITTIQSYDYFWHLATGYWIVDHGRLPEIDPFSLSSDDARWVDGEWLFQIGAAAVDKLFGPTGASLARGLCVAFIFSIGFGVLLRRGVEPALALFIVALSAWGADHRLTTRPETVATALLVLALWLLLERRPNRWTIGGYAVLTVIWMAIHPSALLAPALAGIVTIGRFVSGERGREIVGRMALTLSSGAALLLNPWGLEGILAPLRLARLVGSGAFVNIEWTATRLADFPLVYLVPIGVVILFARGKAWEAHAPQLLVFAFLAFLAIRYVRNHGFFFAAVPLLVASLVPFVLQAWMRLIVPLGTVLILSGLLVSHGGVRTGVDQDQFPVAAVSYLEELGLEGNVYNPDQLGGYLIWSFYPDRRVLTDGRNELHISYIEEYGKARLDQRAWNALIEKYEITLAVDEYHRETMDVVDAVSGERRAMPASLIYFPRHEWALIGFDDVAMVFARRDSFDTALIADLEFQTLVPDGAMPLTARDAETAEKAEKEIARAREIFGRQDSIERISRLLGRSK